MSHLSDILDQQAWLSTAALNIAQAAQAEAEQPPKPIEQKTVEQTISYSAFQGRPTQTVDGGLQSAEC